MEQSKVEEKIIENPAVDRARSALAKGDVISAYDVTVAAMDAGEETPEIQYLQVLALARMGHTGFATDLFHAFDLDQANDPHQKAVGARLAKDRALKLQAGPARNEALSAASDAYMEIFLDSGDPYPGINAASLALLSGKNELARKIANDILAQEQVADPQDYYMAATLAEALLILGQIEPSAESLALAAGMANGDFGAQSTSCRQLELLAQVVGVDELTIDRMLAPIRPPRVMHFSGHIFAPDTQAETTARAQIDRHLEQLNIGMGYGALAAGADILIAEALLARGGELHVVLPFAVEDFIAQSVRPAGEEWVERFERCMASATGCSMATEMAYVGDQQQFAYSSKFAMGLAKLRAQHLGNVPVQMAMWDGVPSVGPAGSGADVATWRDHGGQTLVIEPGQIDRSYPRPPEPEGADQDRALAAILFTDFKGFSKLPEEALPRFWGGVMQSVADVLEGHQDKVLCKNSWGDALYAVASSAAAAANIALELQARLGEQDLTTLGLESRAGMRIGAHYGPAYRMFDPITSRTNFYGTEVSRAARIEPVAPPGTVFITEPLAAILALESPDEFRCRYVGQVKLAKEYGTYPMYLLEHA